MLKIIFYIPEDQVAYVQRFGYELEGRQRIVQEIITTNSFNPGVLEGEAFKKYHDMYQESVVGFSIAKAEIEKTYVPDILKESPNGTTTWNLDYANNEMIIRYTGSDFDKDQSAIQFAVPRDSVFIEVIDANKPAKNHKCCGGNCA